MCGPEATCTCGLLLGSCLRCVWTRSYMYMWVVRELSEVCVDQKLHVHVGLHVGC